MMLHCVMFDYIIHNLLLGWCPINVKLTLVNYVLDAIQLYIDKSYYFVSWCIKLFLLRVEDYRWSIFSKRVSEAKSFLTIEEWTPILPLRRYHYILCCLE